MKIRFLGVALALTLVLTPNLASVAAANHDPAEAAEASMQAHHKMMAEMDSLQPTGDADRDFVLMMIPHHQGAIDAAKVELQFGHDETLRAMAEEIISAQEREIGELREWLATHP